MNKNLRFSIVIPTRERADTLKYCLQTCVEQELFDNYEIIVSDNNSSQATKDVVDSFNNNRIRYFSTGKTLAMYENFEFAISKATGEYVIVLGDDDGITLKGLYHLDKIITKTSFKVIAWQWLLYFWPDGVPIGLENVMYIPTSFAVNVVKGKEAIKSVIEFKMSYNRLPMLYINSAVHRDVINELKSKTGRVFNSITPDCYSGICMAYLSKQFLFLDRSLTIAAISGKSNGNNQLYKKPDNAIFKEFNQLNDSSAIQFHKSVPNLRSINAIVSDVFMQAKEGLFMNDQDLLLDRKLMISKVLEDLIVFDKAEWHSSIVTIKNTLLDDDILLKWFEKKILSYKPKLKDVSLKENLITGLNFNTLTIDGSNFGCKNVYDVAQFYNKSFDSDIYIPDDVKWNDGLRPEKFVSILEKVFKRLKHACRIIIKGS